MIVDNGKYYLYRHIRLDTGKPFYIGIGTKRKSYATEKTEYTRAFDTVNRNKIWQLIFAKTGISVEIVLESDSKDFVYKKEIEFIQLYGMVILGNGILCNMSSGGDERLNFPEVSIRIGHPANFRKVYCYDGFTGVFIKEYKTVLSAARSIPMSIGRFIDIVKSDCIYKGVVYFYEYKGELVDVSNIKVRISNGIAKDIYKIHPLTGDVLGCYRSAPHAAKNHNVTSGAITTAINGKKSCSGFYWSYTESINLLEYSFYFDEILKINPSDLCIIDRYTTMSSAAEAEKVSIASISHAVKSRGYCNGFLFCRENDYKELCSSKLKKPLKRKIIRVGNDGSIKEYEKIADAAKELSVNSGRICEAIKRKIVYFDFKWEYSNN